MPMLTDLAAEAKAPTDADTNLTTDLAAEAKSRKDGDDFLQAQVRGLWGGLQKLKLRVNPETLL